MATNTQVPASIYQNALMEWRSSRYGICCFLAKMSMMMLLDTGATISCRGTSECEGGFGNDVSPFHFTPRLCTFLGFVCFVFGLGSCRWFFVWGGLCCVVGLVFPGGTVDVFLNLVRLDMTATVLSNAATGKNCWEAALLSVLCVSDTC